MKHNSPSEKRKDTSRHISHGLKQRLPRLWTMVIALIVASGAMFLAQKCSHRNDSPFSTDKFPQKSGGDTLDVAIEISPLGYSLAGDTISGLDYELLLQFSRDCKRPVKFHPFAPLAYAVEGLENGYFDLVVSSLPSTRNLKDSLLLTDKVYLDREVLVQTRDSASFIANPEDLASDSVWIAAGSPFIERLRNLSHEIGDTIFIIEDAAYTAEHLLMLVAAGQIPRAVVNEGVARSMASSFPDIDISTPVSFTQFQVWALDRNRSSLRDSVNTWLKDFSGTESYNRLVSKYLGK